MLVRSLQSYEETNHFLRAMFLGLVPALLDSNLYRIAIKRHPKKYDTNLSALLLWYLLTLLNWDLGTLLRGHLPASGLRHLKKNTLGKSEQKRQTNSNSRWCRLPWGWSCSAALELARRSQEALDCIECQSPWCKRFE